MKLKYWLEDHWLWILWTCFAVYVIAGLVSRIAEQHHQTKLEQERRAYIVLMQHNKHGGYFRDYYDTNGVDLPPDHWPK